MESGYPLMKLEAPADSPLKVLIFCCRPLVPARSFDRADRSYSVTLRQTSVVVLSPLAGCLSCAALGEQLAEGHSCLAGSTPRRKRCVVHLHRSSTCGSLLCYDLVFGSSLRETLAWVCPTLRPQPGRNGNQVAPRCTTTSKTQQQQRLARKRCLSWFGVCRL